uniref:Uncharacterized protein n=1 Tax=Panagrolaimus sp. ES5 TaxID=591445 RepID=A0AC34G305_9BILA
MVPPPLYYVPTGPITHAQNPAAVPRPSQTAAQPLMPAQPRAPVLNEQEAEKKKEKRIEINKKRRESRDKLAPIQKKPKAAEEKEISNLSERLNNLKFLNY